MKNKKKLLLVIVLFPVIYYFYELFVGLLTEGYCIHRAEQLPEEQKLTRVEPFEAQKKIGMEWIPLYYKTKWECEMKVRPPLPLHRFLNNYFP